MPPAVALENFGCASSCYCAQYGDLVIFWGAGGHKHLYSIGLFRWFNQRLAVSPVFNQVGVGNKSASIKPWELFGGIGFRRIYQNRCDFDAVFRGCILGPRRILGPIVGDLCACP